MDKSKDIEFYNGLLIRREEEVRLIESLRKELDEAEAQVVAYDVLILKYKKVNGSEIIEPLIFEETVASTIVKKRFKVVRRKKPRRSSNNSPTYLEWFILIFSKIRLVVLCSIN